jgi:hypothetical protein
MIGMLVSFLILFGVFFFGINSIRKTPKEEKWELTKLICYSILCTVLTLGVLILIVLFF